MVECRGETSYNTKDGVHSVANQFRVGGQETTAREKFSTARSSVQILQVERYFTHFFLIYQL
jgi:hypothetical protein